MRTRGLGFALLLTGGLTGVAARLAAASDDFERPPIAYSTTEPNNPVTRLQAQIDQGQIQLERHPKLGYLPSLLEQLHIPIESQMLVFSKTSLQARRISPKTPRAVYFNDDLSVGYCQAGDVLEVMATDPALGTVFYTLDQRSEATDPPRPRPRLMRQTDNCLVCHASSRTEGVPGHLARSLLVDPTGQPILSAGSRTVDYRTPFADRWGGWYVTGTHGDAAHQGNLIVKTADVPARVPNPDGVNVTDLSGRFNLASYLSPHSDLVALMVFEHQNVVHNRITRANFTTRQALAYEADMARTLGESAGTRSDSARRRIEGAARELVEALLFAEEAPLSAPVAGTSGFAEYFAARGPRDSLGRSLRDFDLQARLFKYPCSYLIYSEAFDALPPEVLRVVWSTLVAVLDGSDNSKIFSHLSATDRANILAILKDTKTNFPRATD